jgi:hypothetical protein
MRPIVATALLILGTAACRSYDYHSRVADEDGLLPADQYARYGREQAQAVAIAREFGRAHQGSSREAYTRQADAAVAYARTLPDVVTVVPDPLGHRLTLEFRSGWRTMVTPLDDGKRGAETPGLPPAKNAAGAR